ncbi:MAG: peptide chain release factor N(5)-glutamine methyltransferase [Flavobacteriales bacterium]|nr:peptide chain release factor N(5)-glutamine methyltransferase [Flavobacteriales bacterium]MCX7648969.1 peptide chain release factor N(5)-glutamine methyltransferase [Flavobacteriales bacterium]MDW8431149.1 peptide chain release factor N(5)-glutamine methyltransferase [Flavobacteriales bacterium]
MSIGLPKENSLPFVKSWFKSSLEGISSSEADNLFWWLAEEGLGYPRARILAEGGQFRFNEGDLRNWVLWLKKLRAHWPVQYILGHSWFCGLKLRVTPHTLIPRPETEELVAWTLELEKPGIRNSPRILDVGTGSGAIALALKTAWPEATIAGLDISKEALEVARWNAQALGLDITFFQADILSESWPRHNWDILISNPPYVPISQRHLLEARVRDHEPELALFVPDEDVLKFYRILLEAVQPGQVVYVEFGADQFPGLRDLAISYAAKDVEFKKDSQGKWRMARIQF